jgi:cbb3-type cytochrome oxidase subunit 3
MALFWLILVLIIVIIAIVAAAFPPHKMAERMGKSKKRG